MSGKGAYRSMGTGNDGGRVTKKVGLRLRLMGLFRKKGGVSSDEKKLIHHESASIDDSTACESPSKESDDSCSEQFDVYFASSFLPHVDTNGKKKAPIGTKKKSVHWKAFEDAKEMAIPPSPPKLVRTRKQPLPNGYATNKAHKTESTPTSPRNSSQNEVQVPCVPLENDYNNLTTDVQAPPEEIVAEKANESPSNALNTTAELLSFDDDLIDTVDKSQADFNKMLDRMSSESKSIRMMNPFSDETVLMSLPEAGTAESESMISKPMGGIVKYFSKLKAAVGETSNPSHDGEGDTCTYGTTATSVYPELLKTKMDSIAKAFCSVELESTAKNSELPTNHLCTFIECTDPTNDIPMGTLPEHLHAPLNLNSPLNRSWFSLNEDSDSISKLSMPIGTNDMDLSVTSEMSPTPLMEKEPIAGFSHGETHL